MKVFAISDLHLSTVHPKPMDIFGDHWANHVERLSKEWSETVSPGDLVLVPGDISWAKELDEAIPDLEWIHQLPGLKILLKGNHDYWWHSATKVRQILPSSLMILQYDAIKIRSLGIGGTRGWILPGASEYNSRENDGKDQLVYTREIGRLMRSLEALVKLKTEIRLVMCHYPPLWTTQPDTEITALLEQYQVNFCVYGHIHHPADIPFFEGHHRGVEYWLVACDYLQFRPRLICEL
ncbi:MAG: metallophosphoesterase [Candidatus Tectomicrobia bacterium]|nr:metallophosphoesterase [Candidatus Tectomicrobia bacterium]